MLDDYAVTAEGKDLDVTLLLTIATSAFVIPYERLSSSNTDHIADDRTEVTVAALQELERRSFGEWVNGSSWRTRFEVPREEIKGGTADTWAARRSTHAIASSVHVGRILKIARNALAHGSIFIQAAALNKPGAIVSLVFVSEHWAQNSKGKWERTGTYNMVICSPTDFEQMLRTWISFLEELRLPLDSQDI